MAAPQPDRSSRPLSIANLEDALRISPPTSQPSSAAGPRPSSLLGGSTPTTRPGNGLGSVGLGIGHQPRPVSEAFAQYEAEQLDRWFDELGHYERTLEAMSRAKRDDNFRDELRAIEQWFTVLSDPERAAALHQLLQHANYVQLRFLLTVIQKLIKEAEKDSRTLPSMGPGPIGNGRYKQRLFDRHSAPNVEEQYYRYLAGLDVAAGPANPSTRPSSIHERPASLHERSSIHDRPASIHERSSIHERPPSFHERPSSYHELQRPPSIHDGPGTSRPPSFHEASLGGRPLSFHETFNNRPLSFHERHDRPASFHEASSALGPQLSSALFDDANLSRRHSTVSLYGARARSDMNIPYPIKLDPLPENDGYRRSPGEPSPAPTRFDSDVWGSGTYNLRERLIGGLRDRTARGAWAPGPGGEDDWPGELPPPSTSPRPVSVPSSPIWKPPSSPARSARIGDDDEEPKISVGPVEVEQLQDIPSWLRSLRLHKYTSLFENIGWRDMIKLTEEELEARGVSAMGARKKLLRVFSLIKQGVEQQDGSPNGAAQASAANGALGITGMAAQAPAAASAINTTPVTPAQ